jgi:hypothetical protein
MKFSRLLQFALGLASLFLPGGLPLSGQFLKVGISGNIPIGKLEAMNDHLLIADREQKFDLLKRLGIDANVAEAATSPHFSQDIEIKSIRNRSENSYGIVSLPCGVQGQAFIYLLNKTGTDTWHAVDYIALDCFHATPTYRLLSLSPGEDSVFVQHAHLGHGSGDVQDRAAIYTIRNSRMHEVLSTVDYHSREDIRYDSPPVEQSSWFLQISGGVIEETRITSQNGFPLRAERRIWRWQTTQGAFSATSFRVVLK